MKWSFAVPGPLKGAEHLPEAWGCLHLGTTLSLGLSPVLSLTLSSAVGAALGQEAPFGSGHVVLGELAS